MTLSDRLQDTNGRPAGFDYMRVGLAAMIVVWHTVITSYGIDAQLDLIRGPTRPIWALLLPMFFALSGFLVSGSLERSRTLISFLGLRVIRLFPALAVESLIAMMVIGPIFSAYPINLYFSDPLFQKYIYNIVGEVQYYLPGVFIENPAQQVNAQLWTLPFELKCYLAISIFYIFRLYKIGVMFIFGCAALQIAAVVWILTHPQADEGVVRGPVLVLAFLCGSLLYRFREDIPWNQTLFLLSLSISVVLLYFPVINNFSALPVAYMTIYLGLLNPRRSLVVSSGDYSYGLFLYGFPIQQSVSAALPNYRFWWINLIVAAPFIIAITYLSWHLIEKRALLLRKYLMNFELLCVPLHDRAASLYDQVIAGGLKSRWVPKRLRRFQINGKM